MSQLMAVLRAALQRVVHLFVAGVSSVRRPGLDVEGGLAEVIPLHPSTRAVAAGEPRSAAYVGRHRRDRHRSPVPSLARLRNELSSLGERAQAASPPVVSAAGAPAQWAVATPELLGRLLNGLQQMDVEPRVVRPPGHRAAA